MKLRFFALIAILFASAFSAAVAQDAQKPLRLRILDTEGKPSASTAPLFDAEIVKDGAADLVWIEKDGTVLTNSGDIAAEKVNEARLQDVVNKWRTVAYVDALAKASPLNVSTEPPTPHHALEDQVKFISDPLEFPYVVTINIASTGEVQVLYPKREDKPRFAKGSRYELVTKVSEPLGADHLVVIASEKPLKTLVGKLKSATAADVPALLRDALANMRYQIGIKGMFAAKSRPAL